MSGRLSVDQNPSNELNEIFGQWIFRRYTIYLIIVATLISVASFIKYGWSPDMTELFTLGALNGSAVLKGDYWRLFIPIFLHANLLHLLVNMYALYSVGVLCNYIYPTRAYLFLYLVSGVFGFILSGLMNPNTVAIGASGSVLGLYGMVLAAFLSKENHLKKIPKSIASNLLVAVVITFTIGLSTKGIDNYGHLGGVVSGFILGFIYLKLIFKSHREMQFAGVIFMLIAILAFTLFPRFVKPTRFTAAELAEAGEIVYFVMPIQESWAGLGDREGPFGEIYFKQKWKNELAPWWKNVDSDVRKKLAILNLKEDSLLQKRTLSYLSFCGQMYDYGTQAVEKDSNDASTVDTYKKLSMDCRQSFTELKDLVNPYDRG